MTSAARTPSLRLGQTERQVSQDTIGPLSRGRGRAAETPGGCGQCKYSCLTRSPQVEVVLQCLGSASSPAEPLAPLLGRLSLAAPRAGSTSGQYRPGVRRWPGNIPAPGQFLSATGYDIGSQLPQMGVGKTLNLFEVTQKTPHFGQPRIFPWRAPLLTPRIVILSLPPCHWP